MERQAVDKGVEKGQVLSDEGESEVKGLLNFVQDETPMKLRLENGERPCLRRERVSDGM